MISGSGRGGKKKFADNLNLVPFIDLFSTMIIFLLSTAVWDQLAAVQTKLGTGASDKSISAPPETTKKVESKLSVSLSDRDLILELAGQNRKILIDNMGINVADLEEFFQGAREKFPELRNVVVRATDLAKYENLILVMDQALALDFDELVVMGAQ